jgi:hypothetical protein
VPAVSSNHIHDILSDNNGSNPIPKAMRLIAGRTGKEFNNGKAGKEFPAGSLPCRCKLKRQSPLAMHRIRRF